MNSDRGTPATTRLDWDRKMIILPPQEQLEASAAWDEILSTRLLSNRTCVVILGAPGLGKTDVLRELYRQASMSDASREAVFVDLKGQADWEAVRRRIFEHPVVKRWPTDTFELTLFLDSLDECLVRAESLGQQLSTALTELLETVIIPKAVYSELFRPEGDETDLNMALLQRLNRYSDDLGDHVRVHLNELGEEFIRQLPKRHRSVLENHRLIYRFRLRIGCRSNDWTFSFRSLEAALLQLWDASALIKGELLPLTDEDIDLAIKSSGVDESAFLQEINRAGIAALARRPRHLLRLLRLYQGHQLPLPADDLSLNEQSALFSSREWDEARTPLGRGLSDIQRLEVATRIAAVLVLCGKRAIFLGVDRGDLPDDLLAVSGFVGFREEVRGQALDVGEPEIRDTLTTELFRAAGREETAFDHLTTAEYLAARYLRRFSPHRAVALLCHPDDPEQRIVPALREVAVWLARLEPSVLELLLERDPELLLRSDAELTAVQRRLLVQALLQRAQDQRIDGYALGEFHCPERLMHDGLREQLLLYLLDKAQPDNARFAAFRLAGRLDFQDLSETWLQIVADSSDEPWARRMATRELLKHPSKTVLKRIEHLLRQPSFLDPEDSIRGLFLQEAWPEYLNAQRLVNLLIPPQRSYGYTTYRYLPSSQSFWEPLADHDIPVVMEWLVREETRAWLLSELDVEVLDYIFSRAWSLKDDPRVEVAIVTLLRALIDTHKYSKSFPEESWLARTVRSEVAERRWLVQVLVTSFAEQPLEHFQFRLASFLFVNSAEDACWIMNNMKLEPDATRRAVWLEFLLVNREDLDAVEHLYRLMEQYSEVARKFRREFIVDLESDEAKSAKEYHLMELKRERRRAQREEKASIDLDALVAQRLERVDDYPEEWWELARLLQVKPGETRYADSWERDIRKFPGWATASATTQQKVAQTATRYLMVEHDHRGSWLAKEKFDFRALAGYRALYLLAQTDPAFIAQRSAAFWERWAGIVIDYPNLGRGDDTDRYLVSLAYTYAKSTCLEIVSKLAVAEAKKHDRVYLPEILDHIQDEALCDQLFRLLSRRRLGLGAQSSLLNLLLKWRYGPAVDLARRWLSLTDTDVRAKRAQTAARALTLHGAGQHWEDIWAYLENAPRSPQDRYLSVLTSVRDSIGDQLHPEQVTRLYERLCVLFPPEDDPVRISGVAYDVTPRDQIVQLRDTLLNSLSTKGSLPSVRALEDLLDRHPGATTVQAQLRLARESFRKNYWLPIRPAALLELANEPVRRYVRSTGDLLEVIVESLERLNTRLQGETPLAPLLWNEVQAEHRRRDSVIWTPRSEERLSDLVRWHLENDLTVRGLILNREVQIRPGEGGAEGERTDIQVDVMIPDTQTTERRVGVIIEVKGQWNRDLFTAMKDQLVDRYLAQNPGRAGLYLVGFYRCAQWHAGDGRFNKHRRRTRSARQLGEILKVQASELSKVDRPVATFVVEAGLR